ncbi:3-deoxy-7-phosphoheptulonate synthase [Streptomyces tricolor]|uniref:3-deoxy-7-phosphoheptulonate synthase n=1 Tax=Streptomyces tricolor TaxID=68277 RepID=UPI0036E96818
MHAPAAPAPEPSGTARADSRPGPRTPATVAAQRPDPDESARVRGELAVLPPLVAATECDRLRDRLAAVARGEAFLLHGGGCAETFAGPTADAVVGRLATLLQMAVTLSYGAGVPVIKAGRMSGRYAEPPSQPEETRDGATLPVYRSGAAGGTEPTVGARRPDAAGLLRAYTASAGVLNLIRSYVTGGPADLHEVHNWSRGFIESPAGRRYERLADEILRALRFIRASGAAPAELRTAEFFVSHEGVLPDFEEPLTRRDERTGAHHATSGHLLWIGERARALDGAHVTYAARIANPVAVELGPATRPDEVLGYLDRLDPRREPGRLTFVVRAGADRVRDVLPPLVQRARAEGARVGWVCDPVHGDTLAGIGPGTRRFDDVLAEAHGFFDVHRALGTHAGGLHIELSRDDVTERPGGGSGTGEQQLPRRNEAARAPGLNRAQSLELAFAVAEMMRN